MASDSTQVRLRRVGDGIAIGELSNVCIAVWRENVTRPRFDVQLAGLGEVLAAMTFLFHRRAVPLSVFDHDAKAAAWVAPRVQLRDAASITTAVEQVRASLARR